MEKYQGRRGYISTFRSFAMHQLDSLHRSRSRMPSLVAAVVSREVASCISYIYAMAYSIVQRYSSSSLITTTYLGPILQSNAWHSAVASYGQWEVRSANFKFHTSESGFRGVLNSAIFAYQGGIMVSRSRPSNVLLALKMRDTKIHS